MGRRWQASAYPVVSASYYGLRLAVRSQPPRITRSFTPSEVGGVWTFRGSAEASVGAFQRLFPRLRLKAAFAKWRNAGLKARYHYR